MLILYHKHPTSARTRFLRFAHGGICDQGPMPQDAELAPLPTLCAHPAMLLRAAAAQLDLPTDALASDPGFRLGVRIGERVEQVQLGHFVGIDPPLLQVAARDAEFIDLVQARRLPPLELSLLRLAYEHVLG